MSARSLIVFGLSLALAGCGSAQGQEEIEAEPAADRAPPSAHATRVEVAEVVPSNARLVIRLPGEVEGSREALLAASLGGFVEDVKVRSGERVAEGQILVRVDAAIHQAHQQVARAQLQQAEADLARAERLRGSVPASQREAAQTAVTVARAASRTARIQASRAVIRAPFAGVVAEVDVEEGEVAAPGAPVLRLIQLQPAKVTLSVADRDVVALREGMSVSVRTAARPETTVGAISHINPAADIDTRAFMVDVEVANEEELLLPGMIATVELNQDVAEGVVVLPQYVIVTHIDENGVFVLEDGVARWRPVTLGSVVRDQVVVDSGLAIGETVIVTGHRELAEGDAVVVTRSGACCTEGRVVFGARE